MGLREDRKVCEDRSINVEKYKRRITIVHKMQISNIITVGFSRILAFGIEMNSSYLIRLINRLQMFMNLWRT